MTGLLTTLLGLLVSLGTLQPPAQAAKLPLEQVVRDLGDGRMIVLRGANDSLVAPPGVRGLPGAYFHLFLCEPGKADVHLWQLYVRDVDMRSDLDWIPTFLAIDVGQTHSTVVFNLFRQCFARVHRVPATTFRAAAPTYGAVHAWPGTSDAPRMVSAKILGQLSAGDLRVELTDSDGGSFTLRMVERDGKHYWWRTDSPLLPADPQPPPKPTREFAVKEITFGMRKGRVALERWETSWRYLLRLDKLEGEPDWWWLYDPFGERGLDVSGEGFIEVVHVDARPDRMVLAVNINGYFYAWHFEQKPPLQYTPPPEPQNLLPRAHGLFSLSRAVAEAKFRGEFANDTLELDAVGNDGKRTTYKLVKHDGRYRWEEVGAPATAPSTRPATQPSTQPSTQLNR